MSFEATPRRRRVRHALASLVGGAALLGAAQPSLGFDDVTIQVSNGSSETLYITSLDVTYGEGGFNTSLGEPASIGPSTVGPGQTVALITKSVDEEKTGNLIAVINGTFEASPFRQCAVAFDPLIGDVEPVECDPSDSSLQAVWPFSTYQWSKPAGSTYVLTFRVPRWSVSVASAKALSLSGDGTVGVPLSCPGAASASCLVRGRVAARLPEGVPAPRDRAGMSTLGRFRPVTIRPGNKRTTHVKVRPPLALALRKSQHAVGSAQVITTQRPTSEAVHVRHAADLCVAGRCRAAASSGGGSSSDRR